MDLYFLATELAKDSDFKVSCIVADYGQPTRETIEGVHIIKSVNFKQNPLVGAIKIWRALRKADADMYMIKSVSPGIYIAKLFCRLKKRFFLYRTAHATHCNGEYIKKHPVMGKMFKGLIKHADIVFAQNQNDSRNLKKTTDADSTVVPNAHRLCKLQNKEKKNILWVGRSAEFKRPQKFIELAGKFPAENFVMICQHATGDKEYDHLCQLANNTQNLQFLQRIPFHEIDEYFLRAKVLVNTSDAEGFPNTFIQAGKCAAAILSYNVNPDGFMDKYECGLCCGGDQARMAEKLGYLLENEKYIEYGLNGRRYVEDRHDIVKVLEHYKTIFRQVNR